MKETQVQFLGQEDPLEKGMATYSSILSWRIPWTEESGGLQSVWLQRVSHDWATFTKEVNKETEEQGRYMTCQVCLAKYKGNWIQT